MNDPAMMNTCPTEETLAAFIDGRLAGEARNEILDHVVVCSECRDAIGLVREMELEEEQSGNSTMTHIGSKRSYRTAFAALAASIAVVFLLPQTRERLTYGSNGGWNKVVEAAQLEPERTFEPRLNGFEYKKIKLNLRGSEKKVANYQLDQVAGDLAKADGSGLWRPIRALALAQLLRGDRKEAKGLIEQARVAGGDSDPGFQTDYAAIYLESTGFGGGSADIPRALSASERASNTAKTPENAWNRALALERAGRRAEALRAWQEYVAGESDAQWKKEAVERHIDQLQ